MQYLDSENATNALNLVFLIKLLQHCQQTIRSDLLAHIEGDDDIDLTCRLLEAHEHIDAALHSICHRD